MGHDVEGIVVMSDHQHKHTSRSLSPWGGASMVAQLSQSCDDRHWGGVPAMLQLGWRSGVGLQAL